MESQGTSRRDEDGVPAERAGEETRAHVAMDAVGGAGGAEHVEVSTGQVAGVVHLLQTHGALVLLHTVHRLVDTSAALAPSNSVARHSRETHARLPTPISSDNYLCGFDARETTPAPA